MTSATNERQIAKRKELHSQHRVVDRMMAQAVLATPQWRNWVWRFLERAQLFSEEPEELNPQRLAFEKGRRMVLMPWFLDLQRFAPADFLKMIEENTGRQLSTEEDTPDARSDADSIN